MVNSSIITVTIFTTKNCCRKSFVESIHVLAYKYWIARNRVGKQQTSEAEDLLYVLEKMSARPEAYHVQTNYGSTFLRGSLLAHKFTLPYLQRRADYLLLLPKTHRLLSGFLLCNRLANAVSAESLPSQRVPLKYSLCFSMQ